MNDITITVTDRQLACLNFVVKSQNEIRKNREQYPISIADVIMDKVNQVERNWGGHIDRLADKAAKAAVPAPEPEPQPPS